MTINLNDYREMTTQEFIEEVENQDSWDDTDVEVYREALDNYGLNYDNYTDPDQMWNDFKQAVEQYNYYM